MKKTLLLLSVFTSALAHAQLTQANEPALSETQIMFVSDTAFSDLGNVTGNAAVWDFTKCAQMGTAIRNVTVKVPSTVSDKYPSATKAIDIEGYLTTFFSSTATARNSKGMKFTQAPLGDITVIFNDANDEKVMDYPYDFGSKHSDDFTGEVKSALVNTTCTGKGHFTIDGKGTLKLNNATTLNNVIRYKLVDTVDATVSLPPATIKVIRTQYEYYDLANSKKLPVFVYATLRLISTGTFAIDIKQKMVLNSVQPDGYVSLNEKAELNVNIYPNPTTGTVKVSGLASDALATITDIQGKQVLTSSLTVANSEISLSELPAGVYLLELVNVEGKTTQRIVKQ